MHCGSPWPKVRSALVMCVVYFFVGLPPLVCETSTLSVVRRRMVCALILVSRLSSSSGESVKDCPFATHTVRMRVGLLAKSDASPLASTARYHLPYDCMFMVAIV